MKPSSTRLPIRAVLDTVQATLLPTNSAIAQPEDLAGLNLFLNPSQVETERANFRPAILKHFHHRSAELPLHEQGLRRDQWGGVYQARRLKGMGLYSGPNEQWMHRIRNLKKDQTGYVLGLQPKMVYEKAFAHSRRLREIGIETEMPEGAYELHEVIWSTRAGLAIKMKIQDAFREAGLPEEYDDIPFTVRIDSMGVNHRLKDFIGAGKLVEGERFSEELVREIMLREAQEFLLKEASLLDRTLPKDLQGNPRRYLKFILERIIKNVATLHHHGGVHGQLTDQNLTLDGKFIDYDTLEWLTGDAFEEARQAEREKLKRSLKPFIEVFLRFTASAQDDEVKDSTSILAQLESTYKHYYSSASQL